MRVMTKYLLHAFIISAVKSQNDLAEVFPQAFKYEPVSWVYSQMATGVM